jgi:hypothetical protein
VSANSAKAERIASEFLTHGEFSLLSRCLNTSKATMDAKKEE